MTKLFWSTFTLLIELNTIQIFATANEQSTQYSIFTQVNDVSTTSIRNDEIAKYRGSSFIECALKCLRYVDCKVIDFNSNYKGCRLRQKEMKLDDGRRSLTMKKIELADEGLKSAAKEEEFLSCGDVIRNKRSRGNGVYNIRTGNTTTMTYCHMDDIPACGGGGWTLAMKIDGHKREVSYHDDYWTKQKSLNTEGGLSLNETSVVLPTYWATPLTQICLGAKQQGQPTSSIKWLKLNLKNNASSLMSVIVGNDTHPFQAQGVDSWIAVFAPTQSLQGVLTDEGVNMVKYLVNVRLGVAGYDNGSYENAFIGVGTFDTWNHGMDRYDISCGYGLSSFNTKREASFCYVFIQ